MAVLEQAFNQWANRPADQRFPSLTALHDAVTHHRAVAAEAENVNLRAMKVSVHQNELGERAPVLVGEHGSEAHFTHHSFGQLARRVGAPAAYLRKLSAGLASANLNEGIRKLGDDTATDDKMLFAQNGKLVLRAHTSAKYSRIWNSDITARLLRLVERNPEWQEAPEAFDGSRGQYASDKDMFSFMVDNDRRIFETGPGGGLARGFFVSNSEVGDASFRITTFLYEYVCGNHRVWGAKGVADLRIPHVGNADERAFNKLAIELRGYADTSAREDEMKVASAQRFILGGTKEEVLDRVFGLGVPLGTAKQALAIAEERTDWYGNPHSAWGFTGGLTQIARDLPNADARVELERKAGDILKIAF
jgi:hypothetical protein